MPKMSEIISQIKSGQPINSVCIASETITDEEMESFSKLLEASTTISYLDLSNNNLTLSALKFLGKALEKNTSLRHLLNFRLNNLTGERGAVITRALGVNHGLKLERLNLSIDDFSAEGLVQYLSKNTTLGFLTFIDGLIGEKAAIRIAEAITSNPHLPLWRLETGEHVGDMGGCAFAHMLEKNKTIRLFSLSGNQFSFNTIQAFAVMLTKNKTLTDLYFSNIGSERGARAFLHALDMNSTLTILNVTDAYTVSYHCMVQIRKKIDRNRSLVNMSPQYISIEEKLSPTFESKEFVDVEKWERLNAPLLTATKERNLQEIKKWLDAGAEIEASSAMGTPLLITCAHSSNYTKENAIAIAKFLLERGANVEAKGLGGGTSLCVAASSGNTTLVKLLLDYKANVNSRTWNGATVLYFVPYHNKEMMDSLIMYGAEIEITRTDTDGKTYTPLQWYVRIGDFELVESLIKAKANVNARDKHSGNTTLHFAVQNQYCQIKILKTLLEAGADYEATNNSGQTPVVLARQLGKNDIADFIEKEGKRIKDLKAPNNQPSQNVVVAGPTTMESQRTKKDEKSTSEESTVVQNPVVGSPSVLESKEQKKSIEELMRTAWVKETVPKPGSRFVALPDGRLVIFHGKVINVFDSVKKTFDNAVFELASGYISAVAILSNNNLAVGFSSHPSQPNAYVQLINTNEWKLIRNINTQTGIASDSLVTLVGDRLAMGCHDGHVEVLDLTKNIRLTDIKIKDPCYGTISGLAALHNDHIATNTNSGEIFIHNIVTGHHVATFQSLKGVQSPLAVLPDGRLVGVTVDGIKVWNFSNGNFWDQDSTILELYGTPRCYAVTSTGRLACGYYDGTVSIFDTQNVIVKLATHKDEGHFGAFFIDFLPNNFLAYSLAFSLVKILDYSLRTPTNEQLKEAAIVHLKKLKKAILNDKLLKSAKEGDATKIATLIKEGAEVEAKNQNGETALHLAVQGKFDTYKPVSASIETVQALLDSGVNIDEQTHWDSYHKLGSTPLMSVISSSFYNNNAIEIAIRLLNKGANINAAMWNGFTVLMQAASSQEKNSVSVVQFLIGNKADIKAKDIYGKTVLHFVKRADVFVLLLKAGADLEARDKVGRTPLYDVLSAAPFSLVLLEAFLSAKADANSIDNNGSNALHIAVCQSCVTESRVKLLIEAGANFEAKNNAGQTPADVARVNNRKDFADYLEKEGPKIKATREAKNAANHPSLTPVLATQAGNGLLPDPKITEPVSSGSNTNVSRGVKASDHSNDSVSPAHAVAQGSNLSSSMNQSLVATNPTLMVPDHKAVNGDQSTGQQDNRLNTVPLTSVDATALEQLGLLPVLAQRVVTLERYLDPAIFRTLNENAVTLTEFLRREREEDKLHQLILQDKGDLAYYSMASILLCGTQRACEGIFSGYENNGKKYTSDHVAGALDAMSSIPVVGMVAKFIYGMITTKNFKEKNYEVMRLAFFFVGARKPEDFLRQFSRVLTFARRKMNKQLATAMPTGLLEHIKKEANVFQDWIMADGSSNPLMVQARKDWEIIIIGILEGTLMAPPAQESMLTVCIGREETICVLQITKELTAPTLTSSPAISPSELKDATQPQANPASVAVVSTENVSTVWPKQSSDPSAKLLAKFMMLEEAHAKEREAQAKERETQAKKLAELEKELEKQRNEAKQAATEAKLAAERAAKLEAELKRQAEERERTQGILDSLHKKVSELTPDETPVSGAGGLVQAQLSRNAGAHPLGSSHTQVVAEVAQLDQRLKEVAGHVEQQDQSLQQLRRQADSKQPNPAKNSVAKKPNQAYKSAARKPLVSEPPRTDKCCVM